MRLGVAHFDVEGVKTMLIIEKNTIYLTRGDDAALDCLLTSEDGSSYEMQPGDQVVLTVRAKPDAASPILIQAASDAGCGRVLIHSEDTRGLNPGRYSADMQLNTGDGRHYTFWPTLEGVNRYTGCNLQNFVIMPEVTI